MKKLIVFLLVLSFLVPVLATAQTGTSASQFFNLSGLPTLIELKPTGQLLMRGLNVTSVSTSSLMAVMAIGPWEINFEVMPVTGAATYNHQGVAGFPFSGIREGDFISLIGTLGNQNTITANQPLILATVLRDWTNPALRTTPTQPGTTSAPQIVPDTTSTSSGVQGY